MNYATSNADSRERKPKNEEENTKAKIDAGKEDLKGEENAEQVEMEWPGLAQEVTDICKEVGLNNLTKIGDGIFYNN